jgi:hypothetical protein
MMHSVYKFVYLESSERYDSSKHCYSGTPTEHTRVALSAGRDLAYLHAYTRLTMGM